MGNKYKYDVALSFAEEDKEIAERIGRALKDLDIKYYLFYEHDHMGKNLKELTWKIYHEESKLAMVLISEHYNRKRWAKEEREVIQTVLEREGKPYLLPIRIDDTPVDGISNTIVYERWTGKNACDIATLIFKRLKQYKDKPSNNSKEKKSDADKSQTSVIQKIDENKGFVIGNIGNFNN
jgi:hypothetical protein